MEIAETKEGRENSLWPWLIIINSARGRLLGKSIFLTSKGCGDTPLQQNSSKVRFDEKIKKTVLFVRRFYNTIATLRLQKSFDGKNAYTNSHSHIHTHTHTHTPHSLPRDSIK